jgi:hypothetical protein
MSLRALIGEVSQYHFWSFPNIGGTQDYPVSGCLLYTCDVYRTLQQLLIWSTERESDVALSHDFPQGIVAFADPKDAIVDIVFTQGLTGDRE